MVRRIVFRSASPQALGLAIQLFCNAFPRLHAFSQKVHSMTSALDLAHLALGNEPSAMLASLFCSLEDYPDGGRVGAIIVETGARLGYARNYLDVSLQPFQRSVLVLPAPELVTETSDYAYLRLQALVQPKYGDLATAQFWVECGYGRNKAQHAHELEELLIKSNLETIGYFAHPRKSGAGVAHTTGSPNLAVVVVEYWPNE